VKLIENAGSEMSSEVCPSIFVDSDSLLLSITLKVICGFSQVQGDEPTKITKQKMVNISAR